MLQALRVPDFEVVDYRPPSPQLRRADWRLYGTAACAFAWVLARACIQSITIDEADTYLAFVGRNSPSQWEAAANNHVLNSLLMRLSTALFGLSHLSMRLPALAGAAIYIASALALVLTVACAPTLRWALLTCLVANPFIMDHLVAARGYSLALGFLMACIAIAVAHEAGEEARTTERRCAACSAAAGLSFCANFSFAFAAFAVLLLYAAWLAGSVRGWRARGRLALAAVLPGAALALLIAGSVLLEWAKGGDLVWGAASLAETLRSAGRASLFQPNPFLINPLVHALAVHLSAAMFPALGFAGAIRLGCVASQFRRLRRHGPVAAACIGGGAAALALCLHDALFHMRHILLPLDRTAVFLAPLTFIGVGGLAAVRFGSRADRISRGLCTGVLVVFAAYFLCCLRLTYFRTWQFDADAKNVYSVLAYYNHQQGVTHVSANWRYVAALNYYRAASGRESIDAIPGGPAVVAEYPPDQQAYVLFRPSDQPFIDREGLRVVYSDSDSGVAVALPPPSGSQLLQ
jgi:hypothetical protein